ncbi:hypothetical protein TRFO_34809 [Tritrichomonas foetus]|uniref:CYRIA/CYRIB Rac1 binding domain-containing protein n=1 Tax=Tritrichomonas foetus TaxID=1144522 RepID=A0A1J4JMU9_9EUKA|nr:hypothetical protein TRFO_34809 [Tritrichomonas foetus]|eukprot:OHS98859.1 hypothetical protein TRFO_34809 [Tritrichomonas foetus]
MRTRARTGAIQREQKETIDLLEIKFADGNPNSAPMTSFFRLPNETCSDHGLYLSSGLSATTNMIEINKIEEKIKTLDDLIAKFYSRRAIMSTIHKHVLENPERAKEIAAIAVKQYDSLPTTVALSIDQINQSIKHIVTIFTNSEIWSRGLYSDELLFTICSLIHRIFVLDKIKTVKNSIKNDINAINQLALLNSASSQNAVDQTMISWLNDKEAVDKKMNESFKNLPNELFNQITSIFYSFISRLLNKSHLLLPQDNYVLRISLAFFIIRNPNGIPQNELSNIISLFAQVPIIPLFCEFSFNIIPYLTKSSYFKGSLSITPKEINPKDQILDRRQQFSEISMKLKKLCSSQQHSQIFTREETVQIVSDAIQLISSTTNLLREQYAQKLEQPPTEPQSMKPYERSVRFGYTIHHGELKTVLQLLSLCRELNDMIRLSIPTLYPKLCVSIQQMFQDFIKNGLEYVHSHAKHGKKAVWELIEAIRNISGDWNPGEDPTIAKKVGSETKDRSIPVRTAAPSPQLIEFVRIQVSHMITPECDFMNATGKYSKLGNAYGDSNSEKKLNDFLLLSSNWVQLLSLDQTLAIAADQSAFYFKEVQLDLNNSVQFPVKSSIPFILCQFALDSYIQPEITDILFYPLSIYDDAANVALNCFKSKLMFDEIKAEARVALSTLSVLIGEFTFNAYETFCALKQLPEKVISNLKQTHARHWPNSQAYRLRTLLQQNRYYLLSKQISLKSLIAPRIDQEVNNTIQKLYDISREFGLSASLAVDYVVNIVKETHRILIEQGLPLMPFQDIVEVAKENKSLESFNSNYFKDILQHLTHVLIRTYSLAVAPIRFIPPKKIQLPAENLGKHALGKILKDALDNTVSFVTVYHFSTFIRNISDGSVVLLAKSIQNNISRSFYYFLNFYTNIKTKLTRIHDATFGTPSHEAFTRYEGAYKYFLNNKEVASLIRSMQILGNTFAVAEVLDQALSIKKFNVIEVMNYLRSVNENGKPLNEIENLFDKQFQEAMKIITSSNKQPNNTANSHNEVNLSHFLLDVALSTFINEFDKINRDVFYEEEPNISNFSVNNGFACVWSVLEFIFCFMESKREGEEISGLVKYGQGVILCASLILLLTDQVKLSNLFCIGKKLQRHKTTDMTGIEDKQMNRFLSVSQFERSVIEWGLQFFQPHIHKLRK